MLGLKPALQSSQGRSRDWSGARLTNCFAEMAGGDKRSEFAVMAIPGLTQWATAGDGPIRGRWVVGGVLYVVSGDELFSVSANGVATRIGEIDGTGPVRMASNYTELCIATSEGTGYVYSGGLLLEPLTFDVSDVIYADGYMIWVVKDSEQFFISGLDDALTYDAADIASVEGFPDDIVGAINDHREIQFFGRTSTEIFYNSGAFLFPFERQGNAFIERGCLDRDSLVKIDNSVMFVGDDRVVYTLNGYQPQRISNHYAEYLLRDATYARAWTYTQEGHKFYILECDRGTVAYDCSTQLWHDRASWAATWWRCNGAAEAYDLTIMSDRANGNLYTASLDVFDEDGEPIAFELLLPTIEARRQLLTMHAFEIVCEVGVGNASAETPQIMLSYSDDNGHTWSNEMWRTMGAVGTYRTRAVWRKLGQFRNRQIKVRITDAARKLVISYFADVS